MFDPALADFSGIVGSKGLYISEFMQSIVLEVLFFSQLELFYLQIHASMWSKFQVNEEGAQAAGAGAATVRQRTIDIPLTFTANQPFLFAIVEKTAWNIWFMGRIVKI